MDEKVAVSKELYQAFTEYGFVYLKNPGLPEAKRRFMFESAMKFFQLPTEVKQEIYYQAAGNRGWSPIGTEKLTNIDKDGGQVADIVELNEAKPDQKEMFEVGSDLPHHDHTPNLWPPEEAIPNFRNDWMDLFWSL